MKINNVTVLTSINAPGFKFHGRQSLQTKDYPYLEIKVGIEGVFVFDKNKGIAALVPWPQVQGITFLTEGDHAEEVA